jgi:peroxiredoxin Q/BCP
MHFRTPLLRATAAASLGLALSACGAPQRPDGGKGLLPQGTAPSASLKALDQDGAEHSLAAERGHFVVVYFYPKDATPGCTAEACAFRDFSKKYEAVGVTIFGVSSDDVASHKSFATEHHLVFPLLADPDGVWASAFGVSRRFGLDSRVTFLLDGEGKVAKVYPNVDPGVHAEQVLGDVAALKK